MSITVFTLYDPPPIPDRRFDFRAMWTDYEMGDPIGYGRTEQEALSELAQILGAEVELVSDQIEPLTSKFQAPRIGP